MAVHHTEARVTDYLTGCPSDALRQHDLIVGSEAAIELDSHLHFVGDGELPLPRPRPVQAAAVRGPRDDTPQALPGGQTLDEDLFEGGAQ
jgi:hypothetical protein